MASAPYARQLPNQPIESLHRRLADFNRQRHAPAQVLAWEQRLETEHAARLWEGRVVEEERAKVIDAAAAVPTQPREFVDWFEGLREVTAQQTQRFYQWLADAADRAEVTWLLSQETAGGEPLDDLLALTQLQLPWRCKLEAARCYWDEMGQGEATAMPARILSAFAREVQSDSTEPCVVELLARSNLMMALASNRHYAYQSIGALGMLELGMTGPARSTSLALKRLGFSVQAVAYYASRSSLSILRSHSWLHDVVLPVVAQDSRVAPAVAEGALMRLAAEGTCVRRYERELCGVIPLEATARSGRKASR